MKFPVTVLFLILLNCKDLKPSPNEVCFSKSEKEDLIEAILKNKTVKNYLHLEIEDRNPIKLKANEIITEELDIKINNHKVIITNNTDINHLVLLKFREIFCDQKKANFSIFFKIEGANIMGEVQKNENWEVVVKKEVEF